MDLNIPEVVAEVSAAFNRYEAALTTNDVPALDSFFWNDPRVHPLLRCSTMATVSRPS